MATLSDVYATLTDNILAEAGQCVLILGPELSVDPKGVDYKSYFKNLASRETKSIDRYFDNENLFTFNDTAGERDTRTKVKSFYSSVGDQVLLEMISRIKFPLIINVCPDKSLNNVFKKKSVVFQSGFFSKESKPIFNNLLYPSKDNPILYNIFGSIDP